MENIHIKKNNNFSNTDCENNSKIIMTFNKNKKIELKNLDAINKFVSSEETDEWTKNKIIQIRNPVFKNNVVDLGEYDKDKNAYMNQRIVSSIRLLKFNKLGKKNTPLVWEYYKNRGNLDVNVIIKKYQRENLIINYSLKPLTKPEIKNNFE